MNSANKKAKRNTKSYVSTKKNVYNAKGNATIKEIFELAQAAYDADDKDEAKKLFTICIPFLNKDEKKEAYEKLISISANDIKSMECLLQIYTDNKDLDTKEAMQLTMQIALIKIEIGIGISLDFFDTCVIYADKVDKITDVTYQEKALCFYIMGTICYSRKLFRKAIIYFKKSRECHTLIDDNSDEHIPLRDVYMSLADCYGKLYCRDKEAYALSKAHLADRSDEHIKERFEKAIDRLSSINKLRYSFKQQKKPLKYNLEGSVVVEKEEYHVPDILFSMSTTLGDLVEDTDSYKRIPIDVSKKTWVLFNNKSFYNSELLRMFVDGKSKSLGIEPYKQKIYVMLRKKNVLLQDYANLLNFCNHLGIEKYVPIMSNIFTAEKRSYIKREIKKIDQKVGKIMSSVHKDLKENYNL